MHAPIPWTLDDAGPNSGNVVRGEISGPNGEHIADLIDAIDNAGMTPNQWLANARLIAAAPELLAALIACEDQLTREGTAKSWPAIETARAAIAKAKGE